MELSEVRNRLVRNYQYYKSNYDLDNKREANLVYRDLYNVEYTKLRFCCDLSFSYLHWSLIEQIEKGTMLITDVDDETVEKLLLNILPHGDTILHKLHKK
jgi:hypothetical protein